MKSKKGLTTLEKSLIFLFVALMAVTIGIVVVFVIEKNNSSPRGGLLFTLKLLVRIQIYLMKIMSFAHLLSSDFPSDIDTLTESQW